MRIVYENKPPTSINDLRELLEENGWDEYKRVYKVYDALQVSSHIIIAKDIDNNNKLVAMVRSMDDGKWSANIDCVLVHPDYQKQGIGTKILKILLEQLKDIEYINLSPNDMKVKPFYEKLGFMQVHTGGLMQIVNDIER